MSRNKAAGTRWESAVVGLLRAWHPFVERRALAGGSDKGDLVGLPGWVVECKATRELDPAGAIDEARREAANAGTKWYAAVIKRRGKPTGRGYVVMDLEVWARLLADDQDGAS